jgi:uncharacterized protein (DUF885 family)
MLETVRTFTALSEEFVEQSLRLWPVAATAAGIHDYDDRLPDDSPEGFQERSAWLRDLEQRLAASVVWEEMPTEQRVDYALLRSRISVLRADLEEIRSHARDPVRILCTALDGVALLVTRPFATLEERKESILSRLMATSDYLAGARAGLEPMPAVWIGLALEVADGAPGFVREVVQGLLRSFPTDAERIEHAGVRANAAIADFREALERDLGARASGDFALGERWLDFRLEREHMLPLRSEALEPWGRQQVEALRRAAEQEARRIDPSRPWREVVEEARRPAAGAPDAAPAAMAAELARAQRFVAERRLAPVPDVPVTVVAAHAWQRSLLADPDYLAPAAFELEPAGLVLLAPADAAQRAGHPPQAGPPGGRGPALGAARAGWPGRHLQRGLAIRCGSRLRRLAANDTLTGGWALYAEELMVEEGFCTTPADRLGLVLDLLAAAACAVADTTLQRGRMSVTRAADYLAQEALLDRATALAEAKRLTLAPARAIAALVGRVQIVELREEARRRLGPRYDRLDFHAALLACGALAPALLREELWERLGVN